MQLHRWSHANIYTSYCYVDINAWLYFTDDFPDEHGDSDLR